MKLIDQYTDTVCDSSVKSYENIDGDRKVEDWS